MALTLKDKHAQVIKRPGIERKLVKRLEPPKFLEFISYASEDVLDLVQVIEEGLPVSALERFQAESTLPLPRVLKLVRIPERTYARRRVSGRLSAEESDRLVRVGRLFSAASGLFGGDVAATVDWLSKPLAALHRTIPLDVAETEAGSHEVERVIQQLQYGVFP
jgi:putative toxin-antitoxin system antitoxin component (TIGR02293 family)